MSYFDISVPILTALRLPGIGVCTQRTRGANSSQTASRSGLRLPLITTMTSSGCCSVTRVSTSRNRSSGSSTTGTMTLVVSWCSAVQGRYRRDRPTLRSQRAHTRPEKIVNRYSSAWSSSMCRICRMKMNIAHLGAGTGGGASGDGDAAEGREVESASPARRPACGGAVRCDSGDGRGGRVVTRSGGRRGSFSRSCAPDVHPVASGPRVLVGTTTAQLTSGESDAVCEMYHTARVRFERKCADHTRATRTTWDDCDRWSSCWSDARSAMSCMCRAQVRRVNMVTTSHDRCQGHDDL